MIEGILRFSLQNRYFVVLITAAVAAFGVHSLKSLPIDAIPDITNKQVQVNTVAPALSPLEIEKQVTFPVETALAGISGLEGTRSISRSGFSQVTAIFEEDVDIYFARAQINERLAQVKESMPENAQPAMGAITTGLGEIYMWSVKYVNPKEEYLTPEGQLLKTDIEKTSYLRIVQDWVIKPQLKFVKGVAGIDTIGGYVKEYHIQPYIEKLTSLGLSLNDVADVLEKNNQSIGAGYIEKNGEAYIVRSDSRLKNIEEIKNIVVSTHNGSSVYLKNIAEVVVGKELRTGSASEDGEEVVIGTALMLIGENSRVVSDAVDKKLKEINKSLPEGIIAKTVLNRMKLVDATILTVQKNLTEGALLVITILFLLLGNFRAAFITALIIPLSMLMTSIGMGRLKISGNLMSLGALDFGLIVDGAVIITENCLQRISGKQHELKRNLNLSERLREVMIASSEMIKPSVYGQAIIMMVYIPLLTFAGVEGKMFEPMALTVIIALISAFILSLTFIPAMIAIFIKGKVEEKDNRIIHRSKIFYSRWLDFTLKKPDIILMVSALAFLVSLMVFSFLGREFVPTLDEKDIAMHAMKIPSTSLTQSQELQFEVEKAVSKVSEVAFVFSKTGTAEMASDPMPANVTDTFIILKPNNKWADRSTTKNQIINKINREVKKIPGNNYEFQQPIQMRFNELIAGVRSDVAIKIYGDDFAVLERSAQKIANIIKDIKGAEDVKLEQRSGLPTLEIDLDKKAISQYGLNSSDVLDVISTAVGGKEAGVIFEGDRRFDIIVRLPERLRNDISYLQNLPVLLPKDDPDREFALLKHNRPNFVPLREVAEIKMSEGLSQISRENGKRRIVIQANIRERDIGSFVSEVQAKIDRQFKIPAGYWLEWGGQFKNLQQATETLSIIVPICFFLIFLLLYSALGSVKQALLVFTGVPLALTGGIFALWIRGMPFSISAAVGFVALSGVAVLNGLVMITKINQLIKEGFEQNRAVFDGAVSRLRPVMMTALVASLGFVPMAIATGAGAEVQKPLATVVIGGLITATTLTLLVLPAIYKKFKLGNYILSNNERFN